MSPPNMRAGQLDRRITLQHRSLSTTPNAHGEKTESYATYATVWSEKIDQRSREFFAAQGMNAERVTRFRIRHRSDVLMTDQIVEGGLNYNIVQISEIGRRQGLEIFASAAPT